MISSTCRSFIALLTLVGPAARANEAAAPQPHVFGAAQVQEVYRVLLDRDALLLESITDVIRQKDIQDGHVLHTRIAQLEQDR